MLPRAGLGGAKVPPALTKAAVPPAGGVKERATHGLVGDHKLDDGQGVEHSDGGDVPAGGAEPESPQCPPKTHRTSPGISCHLCQGEKRGRRQTCLAPGPAHQPKPRSPEVDLVFLPQHPLVFPCQIRHIQVLLHWEQKDGSGSEGALLWEPPPSPPPQSRTRRHQRPTPTTQSLRCPMRRATQQKGPMEQSTCGVRVGVGGSGKPEKRQVVLSKSLPPAPAPSPAPWHPLVLLFPNCSWVRNHCQPTDGSLPTKAARLPTAAPL